MLRDKRKRNLAIGAAVIAAVVVAIVLIVGTGSSETPYADRGTSGDGGSAPTARPVRRFGQTIRLRTYLTTIEVTPRSFVRFPASEASGPGIGVNLEIRTVGRAAYRDQPAQAAAVVVRGGGEAERVYTPVGNCTGPPEDTIRLAAGRTARFCLPFETTARPDLFVYSAEDGLPGSRGAPETGSWAFPP